MAAYELNVRDYIRIIKKRIFVIISSGIIFAVAAFFYANYESPVYETSTTVKITDRKTLGGMLTDLVESNPGDLMETQASIIKGFPVMKLAALSLKEISENDPQERVNEVVDNLQGQISTEKVGNTNIISITARGGDAKSVMNLANAVAEAYVTNNLLEKNKEARTARKFIEDQLASAESRLNAAEGQLKTLNLEVKNIAISEEVQKKLNDLEFELAGLLQKYTDKHPKVAQVREEINDLQRQLKDFSGKEVDYAQAKQEVEVNRNIYSTLRQKLEEARISEAEKVSDISIVDPALMPQGPVNPRSPMNVFLGAFLGLVVGIVLAFFTETLDTSIGTIEDVETLTKIPVLGVVPAITSLKSKNKYKGYWNYVKQKLMPTEMSKEDRRHRALFAHYSPLSPVTEAFRNVKTNIKFGPSLKTILVTSSGPKEGKTNTITNLALVCAQEGLQTLLVSSDLRKPYLSSYFGIPEKPGLSDIVMGSSSLDEGIRRFSDMVLGGMGIDEAVSHPGLSHLALLPAGSASVNPAEILNSPEFDKLLDQMKNMFDVILFDSPPVLPVADASILSKRVDGVVLCYEVGRTSRHALLRVKQQLEGVGAHFIGIILNHTLPGSESEVYPYYRKYAKEYASEPPKGKDKEKPL